MAQPQRLRGGVDNPPEADRAPIAAASYKLCPVGAGSCTRGEQAGGGIARFGVQVPGARRVDAVAVASRRRRQRDRERRVGAGHAALRPRAAAARLRAAVADRPDARRGVRDRQGLRARGRRDRDQPERLGHLAGAPDTEATAAGCSPGSTTPRCRPAVPAAGARVGPGGQRGVDRPPARRAADGGHAPAPDRRRRMRAGFERDAHRPADDPPARQAPGRSPPCDGARADGARPLRRAALASSGGSSTGRPGHRRAPRCASSRARPSARSSSIAVLQTDADGPLPLHGRRQHEPHAAVRLCRVAARAARRARDHDERSGADLAARQPQPRAERPGRHVQRAAAARSRSPPGGKLVELQVRLSDRWQTFRTSRTDAAGRWAIRYRFKRTRGVQRFRFRARLPREASYPFAAGGSRPLTVRVEGRLMHRLERRSAEPGDSSAARVI